MSLVLAGAAIAAVQTVVAQPAQAGTCGDVVRLYRSPLFGPVVNDWLGTDGPPGDFLSIPRFGSPNNMAVFGNNLKPFSRVLYTFSPMDGQNTGVQFINVNVQYNGVLRDDSFRTTVNALNPNTVNWRVSVTWNACGGAFGQDIGTLSTF